jgi:hypothetical protein
MSNPKSSPASLVNLLMKEQAPRIDKRNNKSADHTHTLHPQQMISHQKHPINLKFINSNLCSPRISQPKKRKIWQKQDGSLMLSILWPIKIFNKCKNMSTKCYTTHHMYNLQGFVLIITGLDTNKPNVHLTTPKPNKKSVCHETITTH